ncbi:MAG: cupin-like domain-containing protein [Aureliella sp.]
MVATLERELSESTANEFDKSLEVDVVDRVDAETFRRDYISRNRPLKMTGMMASWPAMQRWSFDFFRGLNSDSKIHLEVGNVMQEDTRFRREAFKDFIEDLIEDDGDAGKPKAYLSVFRLFDYFPHLRDDVDFSILDDHKVKASSSGWLGPAGTVTGYHIDWGDNILAQIHGRKRLHLAAPVDTPNMYVSKKFDQGTTISEVDLNDVDHERFPKFRQVRHAEIILNPGEMIFIPRGWWHHVQSLDKSISVSNITFDWVGIVRDVIPHRLKQALHNAGLWKCPCTCHVVSNGKWVKK